MTIHSLLIANRGAIARRIIRTCRRLGIRTIAVYSAADRAAWHVREADVAVPLTGPTAVAGYLDIEQLVAAARQQRATAIHPGYGFLSENADFAAACARAGLQFVGPTAAAMAAVGNKQRARELVEPLGVRGVPWARLDPADRAATQAAVERIGCPVLIKAAAGGGGKGMRRVERLADVPAAIEGAAREAARSFGNPQLLVEKLIERPRHIEIQVIGDAAGTILHLGERECSCQRRHQKVVEECPSPVVDAALRDAIAAAAVTVARAAKYTNAGTVEFLLDERTRDFYFLEMNTRLQVEHAVTEAVYGIDLVEWQLRVAAGETLPTGPETFTVAEGRPGHGMDVCASRRGSPPFNKGGMGGIFAPPCGHAVECRLYAEDARHDFLPCTGRILTWQEPSGDGVRVESAVGCGSDITVDFDPMLAKLITWGPRRDVALTRMRRALAEWRIAGVRTNREFLLDLLRAPEMQAGRIDTEWVDRRRGTWDERNHQVGDPFSPWHPAAAGAGWREGAAERAEVTRSERSVRRTQRHAHATGDCTAPMPGRIVKLAVAVGDAVDAGAVLVVMEAMKMEYTITAPTAGQVRAIRCVEGQLVERGAHLVEVV